ncbi:unnamed protein product [Gongylonema pulchrum]|uniref:ZP domain-containing protein n=1 Tax=Gongylonema pulchrum TaxID=637853 RepID=A0A183ERP3_9BILA|nr:unnamed protein product [Gongylonema pulchrum]
MAESSSEVKEVIKERKDYSNVVLPAKPAPTRRYAQANKLRICVNGYELDMSRAIGSVYKFELKICGVKKDGREKELHRGPKNEFVFASFFAFFALFSVAVRADAPSLLFSSVVILSRSPSLQM